MELNDSPHRYTTDAELDRLAQDVVVASGGTIGFYTARNLLGYYAAPQDWAAISAALQAAATAPEPSEPRPNRAARRAKRGKPPTPTRTLRLGRERRVNPK